MAGPALAAAIMWGGALAERSRRARTLRETAEDEDEQRDIVIDQMINAPAAPGQPALMPWMREAAKGLREVSREDTITQLTAWREELALRDERVFQQQNTTEDNLRNYEKSVGTDAASELARDRFNEELRQAGIDEKITLDEAGRQARILADPDFAESEAIRLKGQEAERFPVENPDGTIEFVPIKGAKGGEWQAGVDQLNQSGRLLSTINDSFEFLVNGIQSGNPSEATVLEAQSRFTEIFLILKGPEFLDLGAPQQADIELGERFMSMDPTSFTALMTSNPDAIMAPLARLTTFVGERVAVQQQQQQNWRGRPEEVVTRADAALQQAGQNVNFAQGVVQESQQRQQVIQQTAEQAGTFMVDDLIESQFPDRFPESAALIEQLQAQGVDTSTVLAPQNDAMLKQLTRLFTTNPAQAIGIAVALFGAGVLLKGSLLPTLRAAGSARSGLGLLGGGAAATAGPQLLDAGRALAK